METEGRAVGKTEKQVEKEHESRRKRAQDGWLERKMNQTDPAQSPAPLSLIIAASPKQPKQTKSGLMYFPVTTAWREPNSCSQREMSFLTNTTGKYASLHGR